MNDGIRIRERRKELGLTLEDVAQALGVSRQTIHKYETEKIKNIPSDKLEQLAKILNTTPVYLMGWQNLMEDEALRLYDEKIDLENAGYKLKAIPSSVNEQVFSFGNNNCIPIYGTIPAGIPIAAIQDIEGYEEIDPSMLRGGKRYFGLKVKGNSMYPMFMEGDTIIVRQQPDCESGQVCAVRVNGDDATLKKVIKQGGTTILQPLNPEYEPMFFVGSAGEPSLEIMGVVVEIRRKL